MYRLYHYQQLVQPLSPLDDSLSTNLLDRLHCISQPLKLLCNLANYLWKCFYHLIHPPEAFHPYIVTLRFLIVGVSNFHQGSVCLV